MLRFGVSRILRAETVRQVAVSRPLIPISAATATRFVRHASVSANETRVGNLLEMEDGLWRIVKREFSRTAAGRAYVQAELKHLTEGTKKDVRFRSDEMVDTAELDSPARYTVLFWDSSSVTAMHPTTFEQTEIPIDVLGEANARYLYDGIVLTVESFKGLPVLIALPSRVTARVISMDAGGGDSATVVTVPGEAAAKEGNTGPDDAAALASGATYKVRVPKFVKAGDRLIIDTEHGKYLGREQ